MVYHAYRSTETVSTLRKSLASTDGHQNVKHLESLPLLCSMYAESLRFGVQIHIPRSSPYQYLHIGGSRVPPNKLIMVNTYLAHMDESVWDTQNGTRPLHQFHADRFIVDPSNTTSGPARKKPSFHATGPAHTDAPFFSTEGLEGAWIPYGGTFFLLFFLSLFLSFHTNSCQFI